MGHNGASSFKDYTGKEKVRLNFCVRAPEM